MRQPGESRCGELACIAVLGPYPGGKWHVGKSSSLLPMVSLEENLRVIVCQKHKQQMKDEPSSSPTPRSEMRDPSFTCRKCSCVLPDGSNMYSVGHVSLRTGAWIAATWEWQRGWDCVCVYVCVSPPFPPSSVRRSVREHMGPSCLV